MNAITRHLLSACLILAPVYASAGVVVNYNPDASAGEAAFLAFLNGPTVVENFDSLGGATVDDNTFQGSWESHAASYSTNAGTFTLVTAGQGGSNKHNNHLMIESAETGEYGREVLSDYKGDLWLDSNDARKVTWTFDNPLTAGMNAFGFFLADAADISAKLTLIFNDGNYSDTYTINPYTQSGSMGYVSVISSMSIAGATLTFDNSTGNDGWGIDDITIGTVNEPGSALLLMLGLLSLGLARRRVKAGE